MIQGIGGHFEYTRTTDNTTGSSSVGQDSYFYRIINYTTGDVLWEYPYGITDKMKYFRFSNSNNTSDIVPIGEKNTVTTSTYVRPGTILVWKYYGGAYMQGEKHKETITLNGKTVSTISSYTHPECSDDAYHTTYFDTRERRIFYIC